MDVKALTTWPAQRDTPWQARRVELDAYRLADAPRNRRAVLPPPSLGVLLLELRGPQFAERAMALPPIREERALKADPIVHQLALALRRAPEGERLVERFLDEVFQDFKKGELFAHTEAVMALLVALDEARVDWFPRIADAFTSSALAEIGRITRLATRLRR